MIAGATRVEQVEQNVKAIGWALSAQELAEIDKITNKTVDTHVRLFSQIPAKTIEEAKRKLVVTTFEDGIHTADGFSIRCRDQRVERVEANGTTAVLRQLGATILSCDFEQETRTILVATSAKVVSLSSIGKLQEDSANSEHLKLLDG